MTLPIRVPDPRSARHRRHRPPIARARPHQEPFELHPEVSWTWTRMARGVDARPFALSALRQRRAGIVLVAHEDRLLGQRK